MYLNMKCLLIDITVVPFLFFFLEGGGGEKGDEGKRGSDQNYSKRQHFEKMYLQTSLKNFAHIDAKTVLIYFYA